MKIITTDSPAREAGEEITQLIASHAGDTLCLLSGGSALDVVRHISRLQTSAVSEPVLTTSTVAAEAQSQLMSDAHTTSKFECRTIFMMGDERGSRDPKLNNYQQLQERHPNHWVTKNCLRTVPEENESLENFAARISTQLDSSLAELSNPQIIHLMGIGTDGHTAGIFPLPEDQFSDVYNHDQSIVPVHLESLTIDSRASVTPTWIQSNVSHIIGYAASEGKKTTLESLKNESEAIHERPAELWKLKSGTRVYTDQVM